MRRSRRDRIGAPRLRARPRGGRHDPISWFALLTGLVSVARRRVGDRLLRAVDAGAGIGVLGFAGVLGLRAVREASS